MTTAKHFPGHGDTGTDSHLGLAAVTRTRDQIEQIDLVPFRGAIAAGVDGIMVAHVTAPDAIAVKTWERGVGLTRACGTAACAAAVAAMRKNLTDHKVTVSLPGGDLVVEWRDDGHVRMTGPVETEFAGWLDPDTLRWEASARGAA